MTSLSTPGPSAPAGKGVDVRTLNIRPEVAAFALLMERELRANDYKGGWKEDDATSLTHRVCEEADELYQVASSYEVVCLSPVPEPFKCRIASEAADVANMAMMVADVCGCLDPAALRPAPGAAGAGLAEVERPDPWVDTRIVRFDDTIMWGHGAFDFDAWESLRWEMHVSGAGSYAVWPNGNHGTHKRWSFYGGPDGVMVLERFTTEAHAREEAEAYALSIKTVGDMRVAATRRERDDAGAEAELLRKLVEVPAELRALSERARSGECRVDHSIYEHTVGEITIGGHGFAPVWEGHRSRETAQLFAAAWNRLCAQIAATPPPSTGERDDAGAVPKSYVLVPVEPTPEMLTAAYALPSPLGMARLEAIYHVMVEAAVSPSSGEGEAA